MIGRLVWWSALAVVALVTLAAQLDRSARFSPSLAPLVPQAFAGFAAERTAQRAVLSQEPEVALASTRALIAVRPLPSEHLSLLAQAQIRAGEEQAAIATLQAATKRGWRDPLAQLAAAQAAVADGAHEAAALRLQALFATGKMPDQSIATLALLLASQGGREAFAKRLVEGARWPANLLNPASFAIAPSDLAPTLVLAREKGAHFDCNALRRIADRYAGDGHSAESAMIDPGKCG